VSPLREVFRIILSAHIKFMGVRAEWRTFMNKASSFPNPLTLRYALSKCALRIVALCLVTFAASYVSAAAKADAANAEQLRLVQAMSERMRARIDELPVLIPAKTTVATVHETTVTLNRNPVIVDGQRFDGIVITTPATKAAFGWAFVSPTNSTRWYVFRERGEMKGFTNFLRRPRAKLAAAAADMKPTGVPNITFQKLDAASLSSDERYVLWFNFSDDAPAELSIRAGFFAGPLTNERLPALLFPSHTVKAASQAPVASSK
jgi:hypothetical protein